MGTIIRFMRYFNYFEQRKEWGALFIRLVIAAQLIYGTQDNILSSERMLEFEKFLSAHGLPLPRLGAVVSVYAQFFCGIAYLLGLFTRLAACIMIINFTVAILLVHLNQELQTWFAPLTILFCSVFLVFNGAGPMALDKRLAKNSSLQKLV